MLEDLPLTSTGRIKDRKDIAKGSSPMKSKINVLFISHSSLIRGAEKSLLLLLQYIDRDLIEPFFLMPKPGPIAQEVIKLGIKTYVIKYGRWIGGFLPFLNFLFFSPSSLVAIYKIVRKEKIDIIYTNTMVILHGGIVSRLAKIPHIWHIRELLNNNPNLTALFGNTNAIRIVSRLSDRIIAISRAVSEPFHRHTKRIITVIPNCTEFVYGNTLPPQKPYTYIMFQELKNTHIIIGVVGELIKRKAQDDAIRSCYLIKKRVKNIKLVLIGKESKAYGKYLRKLTNDLSLNDDVIFVGFSKDVRSFMSTFDLTLMPSWEEPFGRVTIESMAMGIPVIGTNSGGTAEIIEDGETGYLVPPKAPQTMAERAISLLTNSTLRSKMGKKCKEIAYRRYSPESCAKNVTKIILSTLKN